MSTNEMRYLQPGMGQVNLFTSEKGRIIARTVLLCFDSGVLLVAEKDTVDSLSQWLDKFVFTEDVKITNLTGTFNIVAMFGADVQSVIKRYFAVDPGDLPDWHHRETNWGNHRLRIVRTGELEAARRLDGELCDGDAGGS